MPNAKGNDLTPKQEAFCLAYLGTGNASEAYRRSYSAGKMKPETINEAACRMLANSKVAARMKELRERTVEHGVMSAAEALEEVTRLARFDIRKLYRADGSPIPVHELDDDTARCLAGVEIIENYGYDGKEKVFTGYTKKYKIADKNAALDKLFRHHGLYEKDNRQNADLLSGLPVEAVAAILDRLRDLRRVREKVEA
jgi:phage terminase small subunit